MRIEWDRRDRKGWKFKARILRRQCGIEYLLLYPISRGRAATALPIAVYMECSTGHLLGNNAIKRDISDGTLTFPGIAAEESCIDHCIADMSGRIPQEFNLSFESEESQMAVLR